MKKIITFVLALVCVLSLVGCGQEKNDDILHLGLNAEIVEIDTANQIVYVADFGEEEVLGAKCAIDCKKLIKDQEILYVDYDTKKVVRIQFSDFVVGDKITINVYESQLNDINNGLIEVEQIQLATQRLNIN